MPHLATPSLAAYLRPRGIEVIQRDLNIEFYNHVLTRDYLEDVVARLGAPATGRAGKAPAVQLDWALREGPGLTAEVEEALATLRSEAFYDGARGVHAFQVIAACLELASLPYYPAVLSLSEYRAPVTVDRSRDLLRAVRDPGANMFLAFFQERVLPDLARAKPDIVGISIPTMGQMHAAFSLAHVIKQAGLACHVTIGGPQVTMLRDALPKVPRLFDLIDSAVLFDGEAPLLALAGAVAGHTGLSGVPNLLYRERGQVRATPPVPFLPKEEFLAPDFDGLPLDQYLTPEPVLPLLTARGCYHGRCVFCNVGYGAQAHYRPVPPEAVVAQMQALRLRYGVRSIFFADEAITPRHLHHFAQALGAGDVLAPGISAPAPMRWCGCVRFERTLTADLLAGIARGGCAMLLFGLESASPATLARIDKGTERAEMGRILEDGAQAGIWNHVFFFFGFPGETLENAQETVDFVYEHGGAVHSGSPGAFVLERHAPAQVDPPAHGIRRVTPPGDRDLAIYYAYQVESGIGEDLANTVAERLVDALPDKRYAHFYATDTWRLLYAGRLQDQGLACPPWLVEEDSAG